MSNMSESPSQPPRTDDPQHIDIETIMKEIRAAAARSTVEDYAAGAPHAELCFRYRVYVHAGRAERVSAAYLDYAFPPVTEVEA